ncbi:MAG: endonuclease/exonuclease/phosphatase family protein [Spirochaetales bacterium]|nr:endonuclease/exonuclease/phosphatase family protein [Spirochaetales bacterium]
MKKNFILKLILIPVCAVISAALLVFLFFVFLTIVEYRPKAIEKVDYTTGTAQLEKQKTLSILSWNIGYASLGKDEDFFMDGGKKVRPDSKKTVEKYFEGIKKTISEYPSDIIFIQEIDEKAKRSYRINQVEELKKSTGKEGSFALNYKCIYVPIPFPPIGQVASGVATLTNMQTTLAERRSLPVPFKWPIRLANLKRCILATRIPVYENGKATGKELILANFHLEAFDNGEGKIAQTKALMSFLNSEYEKGNYIIAGGDFNQTFPDSSSFPIIWPDGWVPGHLDKDMLNEGWQFAYDDSKPTCRSNEKPYNDEDAINKNWQYFVIDGFILSPNITLEQINVIDENFQNSDHNPVIMKFSLE